MATTFEQIGAMLGDAGIHFEFDDEQRYLKTLWVRGESPVLLLIILLENGELVQIRAPGLLNASEPVTRPVIFRAMLQMAYETRLVQFEFDPADGEVSTCIDIALEDNTLSPEQLLRCCALLLDVSYLARDRLKKILQTGHDPALEPENPTQQEPTAPDAEVDEIVELAKKMGGSGGNA